MAGIMLLLEGLVIGFGLMLLLSVQGQRRFQVVLSPLLALIAFLLLKFIPTGLSGWAKEAVALGLLSIVLMKKNVVSASPTSKPQTASPVASDDSDW